MARNATLWSVHGQTFGQRVAAERKRRGLAKAEAARQADISQTTWGDVERGYPLRRRAKGGGRKPPQEKTVVRIATLFGWPINDALRWAGYNVNLDPTELPAPGSLSLEQARDRIWPLLTDPQQEAIVAVMSTMVAPHQWPEFTGTRTQPEPNPRPGDPVVRVMNLGSIDDPDDEMDRGRDESEKRRDGNG